MYNRNIDISTLPQYKHLGDINIQIQSTQQLYTIIIIIINRLLLNNKLTPMQI